MTLEDLKRSIERDPEPPAELPDLLRALWCARKGRWEEAHELVQDMAGQAGAWIHAHLHRIEGDLGNAEYWYRRAGKPAAGGLGIAEEWERIASELAPVA